MYTTCISIFILRQAGAHLNIKHVGACCIHGEPVSLANMDNEKSHYNSHAHNTVWICTYSISLGCIPTLQDQEHPWLGRGCPPNHVCPSYEVHDHLFTHTHTQSAQYKHIEDKCILVIANIQRVWLKQGTWKGKKKTLPYPKEKEPWSRKV